MANSMPPPLIPLPSSYKDCDSKVTDTSDPFDSLFTEPEPTRPLFVTTRTPELQQGTTVTTPHFTSSDFGAWVSVPAASDTVQHPLIDVDSDANSAQMSASAPSFDFFDRFTDDAKVRADQNERRVLNELLEHEDDPLYWLKPSKPDIDEPKTHSNLLDEHPPSKVTPELRRSSEDDRTARTILSSSPKPINTQRRSSSSIPSTLTATLPRKWMSTLLSSSVPTIDRRDASRSPPQRKSILPSLTHDSPFATPVFIPSTGAPGFTGDRHWNNSGFEFGEQDRRLRKVELVGRRENTTPILTSELAEQLRTSLPALPRLAKSWSLLYSMDQHGVSLHTFYARTGGRVNGTLIAIRDSEDCIFGAWLGEPLRISPGAYYGSGESFLWRIRPCNDQDCVEVFKWTGKNDYVALCEAGFISFGGGEGKYGLYLDSNLIDGSSARCPTFDNAILCGSGGRDELKTVPFECVGVEAWGVTG